jgi:glycosyltransferase involved in cell wall biosynthesis
LQNTGAQLFIVGDGCEKENLIRLTRELGIEEHVHFAGFVSPNHGLPEIYRLANLFVTASEIETQGIVLLEAAASGLPIVAVNATCISEIVHDGVNGFLASPGDIKTLQDHMLALLSHPEMARHMGQQGRILAEAHGIEATWQRHESLYMELTYQPRAQVVMMEKPWRNAHRIARAWLGLS